MCHQFLIYSYNNQGVRINHITNVSVPDGISLDYLFLNLNRTLSTAVIHADAPTYLWNCWLTINFIVQPHEVDECRFDMGVVNGDMWYLRANDVETRNRWLEAIESHKNAPDR